MGILMAFELKAKVLEAMWTVTMSLESTTLWVRPSEDWTEMELDQLMALLLEQLMVRLLEVAKGLLKEWG